MELTNNEMNEMECSACRMRLIAHTKTGLIYCMAHITQALNDAGMIVESE